MQKVKKLYTELVMKYGWKLAVGVFFYYLIRDVSLYLVLPWFLANKFLN